jgi:quinol monooxygenase YgiN
METAHVGLSVDLVVPAGETGPISVALHALMIEVRHVPGCLECALSICLGTTSTIRFTETWRSEENLRTHVRSDQFTRLAGLMETASTPPTIRFRLPGRVRGLDYAMTVRGLGVS